jgi:DNA-binding response OmpR family regulator
MPGVDVTDDLTGKRILLVDDDAEVLATLLAAMRDTKAELLTAANGDQAVKIASEQTPDLMVLDLMLPGRSGFLVIEKLKAVMSADDLPRVIMITANKGTRHRMYAETLGVALYMTKPFRMDRLMEAVTELLS